MKHIKIYSCLFLFLIFSCQQKNNENVIIMSQSKIISYLEKNMLSQINHVGKQLNNINLISKSDTTKLKSIISDKYSIILHLSGLYCSKCNSDLFYYFNKKFNQDVKLIVLGTNMSQREALILFGKVIYTSNEDLTCFSNDNQLPYITLIDSSLNQLVFFIPELNYTSYSDSCIAGIERLIHHK